MNQPATFVLVLTAAVLVGVSVVALLAARRVLRRAASVASVLEGARRPCYRCGEVEGSTDFMGLRYCLLCRTVVAQMLQAVRHDPPFGFPGGPGYLDFPEPREKKEV